MVSVDFNAFIKQLKNHLIQSVISGFPFVFFKYFIVLLPFKSIWADML